MKRTIKLSTVSWLLLTAMVAAPWLVSADFARRLEAQETGAESAEGTSTETTGAESETSKPAEPPKPVIDKPWEFDSYRVTVWIAVEDTPLLGPSALTDLTDQVEWLAEQVDLSGWIVTASLAPEAYQGTPIRRAMLRDLESMAFSESREDRLAMAGDADKIIMLTVKSRDTKFQIEAREYDVLADMMGALHRNECIHQQRLARHCYRGVADAFSPVARIQDSDERTAPVLPRAAGLIVVPESYDDSWVPPPTYIKDTDILIPMVRHTGRLQLNRPEVEVKSWTCLMLDHRENDELVYSVQSMFRTPLAGRTARRQQRIAMVAKPGYDHTSIALVSTGQDKRPLWGYRVFRIELDSMGEEVPVLVGKTDWRGEIEIDIADGVFQTLYIKNGERTLGRLPLVVGHQSRVEAPVLSDDIRLRAEGVIQGLQSQFLDLVARREVIAKRARYRIEQKEFDGARELIDEIRGLPNIEQFTLTIEQQRRQVLSNDSREQSRIDAMFNRLIELLAKYIDDGVVGELDGELRAAEEAAGVTTN